MLRLMRDAWFAEGEGHYAEMVPEIWPMGRCRAVGVVERWRGLPNGVGEGEGEWQCGGGWVRSRVLGCRMGRTFLGGEGDIVGYVEYCTFSLYFSARTVVSGVSMTCGSKYLI